MPEQYVTWMDAALSEAKKTFRDVPVGCALVSRQGDVVITTRNSREERRELLGHAELNALSATWGTPTHADLHGYTLVSTLEPCLMCAGAIRATGIVRVIYGASNPQSGVAGSVYDIMRDKRLGRQIEVISGVLEKECQAILEDFFDGIRNLPE